MIKVKDVNLAQNSSCQFEFDEYIPFRFRSYESPIGVKYLRLGNSTSALLEILLDQNSNVVRGITLTLFEKVHEFYPLTHYPVLDGLPVIEVEELCDKMNLKREISVGCNSNEIYVMWSNNPASRVIRFYRMVFIVSANELIGFRAINLSQSEMKVFRTHLLIY